MGSMVWRRSGRMCCQQQQQHQYKRVMSSSSSSSVQKEEVLKFSNMASSWWDAKSNPLLFMNATRLKFITNQIIGTSTKNKSKNNYRLLDGIKALDVGCGGGVLSESLSRLGATVTAIDPSTEIVEMAKQHSTSSSTIQYCGGMSIEDLDPESNKFDLICILEVLEHSSTPQLLIDKATQLLHPNGGTLIISTINRTLKSYALAIVGAEYIVGALPPGTHNWNQFLTPQEVLQMMPPHYQQTNISGMIPTHPPLLSSWKLHPHDTDVNWIASYQYKPPSTSSSQQS